MHKDTDMLKVTSTFLLLLLNVCQKYNPHNLLKPKSFWCLLPLFKCVCKIAKCDH